MNCEEEIRVKNEMGEVRGIYVSDGGRRWVCGWCGKKERKKKKEMGRGCMVGKKGRGKKEKEKIKGKKLSWFYLFIHFV